MNSKTQTITIRLPLEDYGWLQRYGEKNDMTTSQVIRKAIRMYIVATNAKKKSQQGVGDSQ